MARSGCFCGLRLTELLPAFLEMPSPARSVGSSAFLERPLGADRTLQNDTRRSHCRCNDVGILALPRRAQVKQIAVGTSRFQSRFHRWRYYRQIEKAQRSYVFSFLAIRALSCAAG